MTPIVMMADVDYFPGLMALLETIKLYGKLPEDQQFVIVEGNPLSIRDKSLLYRLGLNITFYPMPDYSEISVDWFSIPGNPPYWFGWLRKILKKLYLFNMTQYEKIVFIDADMVCLGDLNPLLEMEHFSIRPDFGKEQSKYFEVEMLCTGCMVLKPSEEDFKGLIRVLNEAPGLLEAWPNYGDQAIINAYFYKFKRDQIRMIDLKWGVNKRTAVHQPEVFNQQMKDARLLHYVGFKPWQGLDAPEYKEVDKIWHGAWNKVKERMAT